MAVIPQFQPGQSNLITRVGEAQGLIYRAQEMQMRRESHEMEKRKFVQDVATMDLAFKGEQIRLQQARLALRTSEQEATFKQKSLEVNEQQLDSKQDAFDRELGHSVEGRSTIDEVDAIMKDPNRSPQEKQRVAAKWMGSFGSLANSQQADIAQEFKTYVDRLTYNQNSNQADLVYSYADAADELYPQLGAAKTPEDLSAILSDPRYVKARRDPLFVEQYNSRAKDINEQFKADRAETVGLRKEYNALDTTKALRLVDASFRKIVSGERTGEESAAGDLSMIFNYMKLLDPGSVVRESEFATAQNAAGVAPRVRNLWNRLLTGERLAPEQRLDFRNQARNVFMAQLESALPNIQQYAELAGSATSQVINSFDRDVLAAASDPDALRSVVESMTGVQDDLTKYVVVDDL